MQKKLSLLLIVVLLSGVINFVKAAGPDLSHLRPLAMVVPIGALFCGSWQAQKMNDEYTRLHKRPDFKMNASKSVIIGASLLGIDIIKGDYHDTKKNLVKLACFFLSTPALSETAANFAEFLNLGTFAEPRDEEGYERGGGLAMTGRFLLTYVTLREIALYYFCPEAEK